MDRERVKNIIPILQGFVDGGEIQQRSISYGTKWREQGGSIVIGGEWEYQLKPKAREWWLCWNNDDEPMVYDYESVGWEHAVHAREILE